MIRALQSGDEAAYLRLTGEFYASSAVMRPIPEAYRLAAFKEALGSGARIEGYIVERDGAAAGYGLVMKCYSQEAGGEVVWLDELYISAAYRARGLGQALIAHIFAAHPDAAAFRLEVTRTNSAAIALYKRLGFEMLDYAQMLRPGKNA